MGVLDSIRHRKSIRAFKRDEVERGKLEEVLEAGRLAPSAKNRQQWKFIAVTSPEALKALSECTVMKFVAQAPAAVIVCAGEEYVMRCGVEATVVDASIAMSFMLLAADELGLSTCWIGSFDSASLRERFGIPEGWRPIALTPIGYAAEEGRPRSRKAFSEVVSFEKF